MKWTFFVLVVSLTGEYALEGGRYDTQPKCEQAVKKFKDDRNYTAPLACREATKEQFIQAVLNAEAEGLKQLRAAKQ